MKEQMRRRSTIYGIKFRADEEKTEQINKLLITNNRTPYLPKLFRMGIYFTDVEEALKVVRFFNDQKNGRYYQIFPTSFESLNRLKKKIENDNKLKKNAPIMYHKLTGFRIYSTAEEYFSRLNNINDNVEESNLNN